MLIVLALAIGVVATSPSDPYMHPNGTSQHSYDYFTDPVIQQTDWQGVSHRYLDNMSTEGASGRNFSVWGYGFRSGTLVVRAQMAPNSLYPIYETMSGIESEFFQHHERYPRVDVLVQEVTDCDGDVIARQMIDREWVDRYWNESSNMTVGNYTELKQPTYEGTEQLSSMPDNWTTPQDTWTCRDWERANPNLTAIDGV